MHYTYRSSAERIASLDVDRSNQLIEYGALARSTCPGHSEVLDPDCRVVADNQSATAAPATGQGGGTAAIQDELAAVRNSTGCVCAVIGFRVAVRGPAKRTIDGDVFRPCVGTSGLEINFCVASGNIE